MPSTCIVSGCRSGYSRKVKDIRHYFSIPADENLRLQWNLAIQKENVILKSSHRVCDLHFSEEDIIKDDQYIVNDEHVILPRLRWSLKKDIVPHIFPKPSNCVLNVKNLRRLSSKNTSHKSNENKVIPRKCTSKKAGSNVMSLKRENTSLKIKLVNLKKKLTTVRRQLSLAQSQLIYKHLLGTKSIVDISIVPFI